MKFACLFESVSLGDEVIYVPIGEKAKSVKGILKVNSQGAEIIELLNKYDSVEECIAILSEKYDNDKEELERYVQDIISQLQQRGLLEKA